MMCNELRYIDNFSLSRPGSFKILPEKSINLFPRKELRFHFFKLRLWTLLKPIRFTDWNSLADCWNPQRLRLPDHVPNYKKTYVLLNSVSCSASKRFVFESKQNNWTCFVKYNDFFSFWEAVLLLDHVSTIRLCYTICLTFWST